MKAIPFVVLFALVGGTVAAEAAEVASGTAKLRINLHASPDLGSRITAGLNQGEAVEIVEERGEFVKVRKAGGSGGYLKRKYLELSSPPLAAPPSSATAVPVTAVIEVAPPPVTQPAPAEVLVATAPAPEPAPQPALSPSNPVIPTAAIATRRPWYVHGMAGVGFATYSPYKIQRALDTAGGTVTLRELNLSVPAFELSAGYFLSRQLSAEIGLLDLGAYQGVISGSGADTARLGQLLSKRYPGGGLGSSFSLGAQTAAGPWSFVGRAGGFCSFDPERQFSYAGSEVSATTETCAPLLAARIGNAITPSLTVGLGANAVFFDNTQFTLGLTLQYR